MAAVERENLFTKKAEKQFFKEAEDEAAALGKKAVLLKGFDNNEKNMLIDERAYKIKQASREHTIIVRFCNFFFLFELIVSYRARVRHAIVLGPALGIPAFAAG
jgi:hypothetical protein